MYAFRERWNIFEITECMWNLLLVNGEKLPNGRAELFSVANCHLFKYHVYAGCVSKQRIIYPGYIFS